jgi:hypothetical protein
MKVLFDKAPSYFSHYVSCLSHFEKIIKSLLRTAHELFDYSMGTLEALDSSVDFW